MQARVPRVVGISATPLGFERSRPL